MVLLAAPFNGYSQERAEDLLRARATIEAAEGKTIADDWMFVELCRDFQEGRESLASLVERIGWINAKDRDSGSTGIVKIELYWEQRQLCDFIEKCYRADVPCEVLILKCRQVGMSTVIQIIIAIFSALMPNVRSLTAAHKDDAVDYLRDEVAGCFLERTPFPPEYKPRKGAIEFQQSARGNAKSVMRVESALSFQPGRTMNFRLVHLSEAAMYPNDYAFIAGVNSTLPERGFYLLIQETTGLGPAGQFYDAFVASQQAPPKNDYRAFFFPWWQHPSYAVAVNPRQRKEIERTLTEYEREGVELFGWTAEQIAWYRRRLHTRYSGRIEVMQQEMPSTWMEAFARAGRPVFDRKTLMLDEARLNGVEPVFVGNLLEV